MPFGFFPKSLERTWLRNEQHDALFEPAAAWLRPLEKTLERLAKTGDGYPPYNIERLRPRTAGEAAHHAGGRGFCRGDLEVTTEENQLVVRGRQNDDTEREFLHRGIAARQFQRCFVLADGMRVIGAELKNGLLSIDLERPEPERLVRKINISVKD
jgi:HSP20 family molecular chaperone IbpA